MLKTNPLLENGSKLFTLTIFAVIGILAIPVILPHIFHKFQVFHILLHLSGIGLAAFLSIVSVIALRKSKDKKVIVYDACFFHICSIGNSFASRRRLAIYILSWGLLCWRNRTFSLPLYTWDVCN